MFNANDCCQIVSQGAKSFTIPLPLCLSAYFPTLWPIMLANSVASANWIGEKFFIYTVQMKILFLLSYFYTSCFFSCTAISTTSRTIWNNHDDLRGKEADVSYEAWFQLSGWYIWVFCHVGEVSIHSTFMLLRGLFLFLYLLGIELEFFQMPYSIWFPSF